MLLLKYDSNLMWARSYDGGEWLGIKTMGYDRVDKLQKITSQWVKGEIQSSPAGVAPASVTSAQSSQGDRAASIAPNHHEVSFKGKGSELSWEKQGNGGKGSVGAAEAAVVKEASGGYHWAEAMTRDRYGDGRMESDNERFNSEIRK